MSDNKDGEEVSRPWQSYHTVFTNAKAGMDGVDKEKVQKIVYEMSKGSKYFENEERKEMFIKQKIENMRAQCAKLTAMDISHHQTVADKKIVELEVTRDLSRTWLHVDMDAFYAAVETKENPSLIGKAMAVGGMSMISTANYEARKFGVRAAMPGFIARKLCPELIFVPVDFKKYTHYSELTRKVFHKYDPNFIAASLDEAYLDITDVCKARGISSEEIAGELRAGVFEETGLTCSAGVAPNRMIAKVCSDIKKPNGHFVLPNNRIAVMTFISSLPIRKIGGIGKVTEHILKDVLGISTCEEILHKSAYLCALFSHSSIDFFLSVGLGLGKTDTPQVRSRKSISSERTFSATGDEASLYNKIADIAESLSSDMQIEGLRGRTLTLKLKTASFEVRTRAVSLQKYIYSSEDILYHASKLLQAELPVSLRLIGLRMSHFNDDKPNLDPLQSTLTREKGLHGDAYRTCLFDADDEYDYEDRLKSEKSSYFEHNSEFAYINAGEIEKPHLIATKGCQDKGASPECSGHDSPSKQAGDLKRVDMDPTSVSGQSEATYLQRFENGANILHKKAALPSTEIDHSLWVDDYKCSLCGAELPPSFVEERQEHSDYHFAEMLQKEESPESCRVSIQRSSQKVPVTKKNGRKKQKTSLKDSKHIPIDLFFSKSNQNF
ncbi:Dna polymerase kappa [Thalictrum thalictroides]|uniref:DNA polymerase kappa n=1 Tax=Thalictrum thalictroides TaxID=46969 RepID=A0A7J6V6V6_THATH|nr:Dna polymerase kappa [Thalictrum thalictroides]